MKVAEAAGGSSPTDPVGHTGSHRVVGELTACGWGGRWGEGGGLYFAVGLFSEIVVVVVVVVVGGDEGGDPFQSTLQRKPLRSVRRPRWRPFRLLLHLSPPAQ
ncbi:hypothetical protein EYF80_039749 [Liparis tanakae]|uniref:Uncharacterized protein n=1 Tax=Liparis tanakae TaxID=230148 RepID=A0A4Z2GA26_9TELE|nr:hypothetical protein EYF80_039749 [Liparis tanakae]